jgi:hypothetical protein
MKDVILFVYDAVLVEKFLKESSKIVSAIAVNKRRLAVVNEEIAAAKARIAPLSYGGRARFTRHPLRPTPSQFGGRAHIRAAKAYLRLHAHD